MTIPSGPMFVTADEALQLVLVDLDKQLQIQAFEVDDLISAIADTANTEFEDLEKEIIQRSAATNSIIKSKVSDLLLAIGQADSDLTAELFTAVDDFVGAGRSQMEQIGVILKASFTQTLDENGEEIGFLQGEIDSAINDIIGFGSSASEFITDFMSRSQETYEDIKTDVEARMDEQGENVVEAVVKTLAEGLVPDFGSVMEGFGKDAAVRLNDIIEMFENTEDLPDSLKSITHEGSLIGAAAGGLGLFLPLALSMVMAEFLSPMVRPWGTKAGKPMARVAGAEDLAPQEYAMLKNMGEIREHVSNNLIGGLGINNEKADWLYELQRTKFPVDEILRHYFRGGIDEKTAKDEIKNLGISESDADRIWDFKYAIPGVQDIITMAVREVFDPAIVEKFELDENKPPAFMEFAAQAGLEEKWASKYWQAHWALPSVQMGFEMLHRTTDKSTDEGADSIKLPSGEFTQNVIGRETMDLLLRTADVMPFWRDKIFDISYKPFTRVDVRRMAKMGVLDDDGIFKAYLDLGFDADKAHKMLNFTKAYNDGEVNLANQKDRELTKSEILGLYNDGLLTETLAKDRLAKIRYSANQADFIIRSEKINAARAIRKSDISQILKRADIGDLSFDQAQDSLQALDLTTNEYDKAFNQLKLDQVERMKLPSKSDLDSWFERKIIDEIEYQAELGFLGYSDKYIGLYVTDASLRAGDDQTLETIALDAAGDSRTITKSQLDQLVRNDIIPMDDYTRGLEKLGYDEESVTDFTLQEKTKREARLEEAERRESEGLQKIARGKTPSRANLNKFLALDLITEEQWRTSMSNLGYNEISIELFWKALEIEAVEDDSV